MTAVPAAGVAAAGASALVELYEPLTRTAPLGRRLAEHHCGDDGAGTTCAWYHGFWPFLRIFGMAGSPERHQAFFLDALGERSAAGDIRVLVSGAADYSMLAHVVAAWRAAAAATDPQVTVLDRCPTPGILSTWYAQLVGLDVQTAACDILEYAPADPFDVVCSHSFLSQFGAARRPELVAAWRRLLGPGGRVVTTARLSPPGTPDRIAFSPSQVQDFALRVGDAAETWRAVLEEDPGELALAARAYAERLVVHPTFTAAEVARLFEDEGFAIERIEEHEVAGSLGRGSGPATSQPATHLQIVARRVA